MINTNVSKQYKNTLKHNTMKKRIILATLAVALIAGVSIFAACTKEENKNNEYHRHFNGTKAATYTENPYDFMGQWHNEALTGLYNQYNTLFVPDSIIYNYVTQFVMSKISDMSTTDLPTQDDWSICSFYLLDDTYKTISGESPMSQYLTDPVLDYVTDSLVKILTLMVTRDNYLLTPDDFDLKIFKLEDTILSLELHNTPTMTNLNTLILNDYDMVLTCLAVARYSYSFWYNVATDENNFLHDDFLSDIVSDPDAKEAGPCPLIQKVRNFFHTVATAVTDFISDVATVVSSDFNGIKFEMQPPYNNPYNPYNLNPGQIRTVGASAIFDITNSINTAKRL